MALLAQGARFSEFLGYCLAVLAVGILMAGVIWSLRIHVPEKGRNLFLIVSFAALTTLCGGGLLLLTLTAPLTPQPIRLQRLSRMERGPAREEPNEGVYSFNIDVRPDGSVHYEGREIAVENLVTQLRRGDPSRKLHVTIYADAAAPLGVVQPVMHHFTRQGVPYSVQVKPVK